MANKMTDGNKESAKELLAFFRLIFTTSISIAVASVTLREKLEIKSTCLFITSSILLLISSVLCFYMFIKAVPKIFDEHENIIYQKDIVLLGVGAMLAFVAGGACLILSQFL